MRARRHSVDIAVLGCIAVFASATPLRATPDKPAIATLLARAQAKDADIRLRARRALRAAALRHLRGKTPNGMVLIPGPIEIMEKGVVVRGGFYLACQETTVADYNAWRKKRRMPAVEAKDGDVPVTGVSLRSARAFARAHGARLPTQAELELAATAGGRWPYPWGVEARACRANTREGGRGGPERVGTRVEGRSAHGVFDLLGNVAEWTETPAQIRGRSPRGRARKYFVVGGSWKRGLARPGSRTFVSYRLEEAQTLPDVGFRLAASLPPLPDMFHPR